MAEDGERGPGAYEGEGEVEVIGAAKGRCAGSWFWGKDRLYIGYVGWLGQELWMAARHCDGVVVGGVGLGYLYLIGRPRGWSVLDRMKAL